MGEVYSFGEARMLRMKHVARVARELELPAMKECGRETKLPLAGIAVVAVAIALYVLFCLHVTGQMNYSARAKLLPSMNLGSSD